MYQQQLKVVLQRTFLFQQTNGLCTGITKIVIILFKKKNFCQYFVL